MKNIRFLILGFLLFLNCNSLFSQNKKDSIPQKAIMGVTDRFPITRLLNIEYQEQTPHNFSSQYPDSDLPNGRVERFSQFRISSNINFLKKKKWILGTTLNYNYNKIDYNFLDIESKSDFHYHSTSLNATYFSRLFKKTAVFSVSTIIDGSDQHFERIKGMATGTLVLEANAKTKMILGVVLLVDPNALVPVFLTFGYEHKFNNGWIADIVLPKSVLMRKHVFTDGRISLGSTLEGTYFYVYDSQNSSKTYSFNQMEINSGLIYEHYLGNSFIITFRSGLKYVPISKITEKNSTLNDYIFKANPDASFYFNLGISFNPLQKKKK